MKVFKGIEELHSAVGTHVGYSDWHTIAQEQIDLFARATGDHQWIHVDQARRLPDRSVPRSLMAI